MCWEDVKIARSTSRTSFNFLPPTAAPIQVLQRNYNRYSLLFSNLGSNSIIINPLNVNALNAGILLPVNIAALSFNLKDHGAMVWDEWWAISITTPSALGIVEAILNAKDPHDLPVVQ